MNTTSSGASNICKNNHDANLAIFDSNKTLAYIRQQLDQILPGGDRKLHIGMFFAPFKKWNNGKYINHTFWMSNYSTILQLLLSNTCVMKMDFLNGWALDNILLLLPFSKGICQIDESKHDIERCFVLFC